MISNIQLPEGVDWNAVPVDYQWSGYSANLEEFKALNFLKIETDGRPIYICSSENGVALGNYLSKYIFRQDFISDMEAVFSPGCNYWFFKAWEQTAPHYDDLDSWVHQIVELLIASGLITCIHLGDAAYFVFSHLATYEDQTLPTSLIDATKAVCEKELLAFCRRYLDDFGNIDELIIFDVGNWARTIIQNFISTHEEIEVPAQCYTEKPNASKISVIEVVAALIWDNNRFMICQRPVHKARALLWEFVGGKVEPGETREQALIRECQEELAVILSVGNVFMDITHEYPDITVHLSLFNATIAEGTPQKIEHNDIKWITINEISNYDFCPADQEILKKITEVYNG